MPKILYLKFKFRQVQKKLSQNRIILKVYLQYQERKMENCINIFTQKNRLMKLLKNV